MSDIKHLYKRGLVEIRKSLKRIDGESKKERKVHAKDRLEKMLDTLQKKDSRYRKKIVGKSHHEQSLQEGHRKALVHVLTAEPGMKRKTAKKIINELYPGYHKN